MSIRVVSSSSLLPVDIRGSAGMSLSLQRQEMAMRVFDALKQKNLVLDLPVIPALTEGFVMPALDARVLVPEGKLRAKSSQAWGQDAAGPNTREEPTRRVFREVVVVQEDGLTASTVFLVEGREHSSREIFRNSIARENRSVTEGGRGGSRRFHQATSSVESSTEPEDGAGGNADGAVPTIPQLDTVA